jgi:arsenate reductase (thioredoxin)
LQVTGRGFTAPESKPHGVNPLAIAVMQEDGIDLSEHTSNHVDEYKAVPFDLVLTVCDNANERCPYFPSQHMKSWMLFEVSGMKSVSFASSWPGRLIEK